MRAALCFALVAFTLVVFSPNMTAQAPAANIADLQEQLEDGLKARLPSEFAFIKKVCTMVENDQLPMPLVKSTFKWSLKKAKFKRYPFPYFEYGLRARARKIGVKL